MSRIDWPARLEPRQAAPDLGADQRRQPFGRLVEDEQARVGHQRAADGQHLLLAARERAAHARARGPRAAGTASNTRSTVHGAGARRRLAAVATRFSRTVRLGKTCRPSGTSPSPAWATRYGGRPWIGAPVEAAPGRPASGSEAHDRPHRRGLAHAVAAEQRHHLARVRRASVDAEQHLARAVGRPRAPRRRSIRRRPPRRDRRGAPPGWRGSPRACRWR